MNICKRTGCLNPCRRDYCSATCRKAAWIERHVLRCPKCQEPLESIVIGNGAAFLTPRANNREERLV